MIETVRVKTRTYIILQRQKGSAAEESATHVYYRIKFRLSIQTNNHILYGLQPSSVSNFYKLSTQVQYLLNLLINGSTIKKHTQYACTQTDTLTHASSVVKHQLHPPHPYSWDSCLGNSNHADIIAEGVYGVSGCLLALPPPHLLHMHAHFLSHTHKPTHK